MVDPCKCFKWQIKNVLLHSHLPGVWAPLIAQQVVAKSRFWLRRVLDRRHSFWFHVLGLLYRESKAMCYTGDVRQWQSLNKYEEEHVALIRRARPSVTLLKIFKRFFLFKPSFYQLVSNHQSCVLDSRYGTRSIRYNMVDEDMKILGQRILIKSFSRST
ncbi:hypothetical protein Lal_00023951 [Lupinus albus]|nr:hypothetical protein Lal_00023951 [Lupinus albus]